jgi:hypothetical protein
VIVLGVGLVFDIVRIALWVLAVLANLTVLQRLWVVRGRAVALERERDGGRNA